MNLIQILTAFVVAYLKGESPVKELAKVMNATNRKLALESIPELEEAFDAYDAGAEIDWPHLAAAIKKFADAYAQRPRAKASFIKILKIFAAYYRNSSDTALKQIQKLSALMEDDYLQGFFVRDHIDQEAVSKELQPLVRKLGGKGTGLTLEQSKEARESNPDLYKEYLGLMRQYNEAWKVAIDAYVRKTGETTVPMAEVLNHLKKMKIQHNMPTGFTGRLDAHASWYTIDGDIIEGGAPSAIMFPSVRMNPEYGPGGRDTWVFQAMRADGTAGNYFYTTKFRKAQNDAKFEKVANFDLQAVRKKWLPILRKFDAQNPEPTSVAATIIELLYRTSNRIGSQVNGNSTGGGYGIATLRVKHFYPQTDGSIKFIYLGKDNVKTVALIKKTDDLIAKKICEVVHALAEGKAPSDPLFTYSLKGGRWKPLLPQVVNRVFKLCSGSDITVHKLRTAKGSELFEEYLDKVFKSRTKMDEKQCKTAWMKGGEIVGKQLNHIRRSVEGEQKVQPTTSLKNYIDPMLQAKLFLHYGVPLPPQLEKLLGESVFSSVQAHLIQADVEETTPETNTPDDQIPSAHLLEEVFNEGPEILA